MTDRHAAYQSLSAGERPAGLSTVLGGFRPRREADEIVDSLTQLWAHTMGTPVAALTDDLELLRRWFDPVAQGSRLRRDLQQLEDPTEAWVDPGPPFTLAASGSKRLVTPEGRCALHVLSESVAAAGAKDIFIGDEQIRTAEQLLLDTYRRWSRHRLDSVIGLLEGASKPLQISAAGVVIALLVNRCTAPERALTRFSSGTGREVIDEAFFAAVSAFATTLNSRTRGNPSSARLVSGWMLYEAGRRLGTALAIEEARGGQDGAVWVVEEDIPHVLSVVARDLARGRRGRVTAEMLAAAFDSLVEVLRQHLPSLAAFGLSHERPLQTASLRRDLLRAFDEATTSSTTAS